MKFRNLHSRWLAASGAVLLVLSMSGLAAAATLVDDTTPATTATFVDLNGNGIDDTCETAAVANPDAVTAAMTAVDTNADGVISVTEAAHSGWVGGVNCNHGGYVSSVANSTTDGAADTCDQADAQQADQTSDETPDQSEQAQEEAKQAQDENETDAPTGAAPLATGTDCSTETPTTETDSAAKDAARAACLAALAAGTPIVLAPMSHVELAQSDVVGGKNCNHGGAVSEANKAAKAERDAAKLAAREARDAAKALKHANKHGKHGAS